MDNKYYDFGSKNALATLSATPLIFEEAIRAGDFSENGGHNIIRQLMWGEYPENLSFPVIFLTEDGRNLRNVIEIRWPGASFLISEELKNIFENNNLTGWRTYDVCILNKKREQIKGFYGFSIIGRNVIDPLCPDYIPDFFKLRPDKGYAICTQRVVDVLRKYKIKDFEVELTDNYPDVFDAIVFKK